MTSQLNVDTIVDKAGSGGTNVKIGNTSSYVSEGGAVTQNTVQGLGKAWIKFSGSAASIHGSFNISSLTDDGTGDYSPNFTSNMNTSNDFPATTAGQDSTTRDNVHQSFEGQSSSSINIEHYEGSTKTDCVRVASIISGDLA